MSWFRYLSGDRVPLGFSGHLAEGEHALAYAVVANGDHLVATRLGLWVPDAAGSRRIGWHLISKVTWSEGVLTVTECEEIGVADKAVLLREHTPAEYRLARAGKLPLLVRQRVDGSIRARHRQELADGGVWFVQRKIPGKDGIVLQALADPSVDLAAVALIAGKASEQLRADQNR